jgi:hypothetical protein
VISRLDERLEREIAVHRLRFTCESCAHFDEDAGRCSLGFPSAPHRLAALRGAQELLFCKAFELS